MPSLHEEELPSVFAAFARDTAIALGLPPPAESRTPWPLSLDDRELRRREEIVVSNGRYRFRTRGIYPETYFPYGNSPGVYFFFGTDQIARYVGKSEPDGGIGRRLWTHIGRVVGGELPDLEFPTADYVIVVPLREAPWIAPALESYLLRRYTFQYNRAGAMR